MGHSAIKIAVVSVRFVVLSIATSVGVVTKLRQLQMSPGGSVAWNPLSQSLEYALQSLRREISSRWTAYARRYGFGLKLGMKFGAMPTEGTYSGGVDANSLICRVEHCEARWIAC